MSEKLQTEAVKVNVIKSAEQIT